MSNETLDKGLLILRQADQFILIFWCALSGIANIKRAKLNRTREKLKMCKV
jgi:hypothetical protein